MIDMYDEEETVENPVVGSGESESAKGSSISWPTVMMAAGISGIVSAIVLAIGLVGILLVGFDGRSDAADSTPPTVVNLGAAESSVPQGQSSSREKAPSDAKKGEGDGSDESNGADEGDAGPMPQVTVPDVPVADSGSAGESSAETPQQEQAQETRSGPTEPTVQQLQNDLDFLASGASTSAKAERLEGGQRAVAQAQGILGLAKRFAPMGLEYQIVGPVKVSGKTATAHLELTNRGYEPTTMPMKYVWEDGRWKLTNDSVCEMGAYAQIPCQL